MLNKRYLGLGFIAAIVILLIVSCASMASASQPIPRCPDQIPFTFDCVKAKHPQRYIRRHNLSMVKVYGHRVCVATLNPSPVGIR